MDAELGGEPEAPSNDKPFDDEPFDAGVQADEQSDPKKYIEQLTGKLGQSLRKYTEQIGQPDFELEKFAINSLLSATHTSEMTPEDQKDIMDKVQKAGSEKPETPEMGAEEPSLEEPNGGEEPTPEPELGESIFLENPKKNNMFQPGSNDVLKEDLQNSEKSSRFDTIKNKLKETFNQDSMDTQETEPMVQPAPTVDPKPMVQPSKPAPKRRDQPFLPMPDVQPDPKAVNENNLKPVKLNGHDFWIDSNNRIVYDSPDNKTGVSFDKLTPNERQQISDYIKYRS